MASSVCQLLFHENNKLEETKLIYQPTLKVEGTICQSIMYIHINDPAGPQLATSRTLIHLRSTIVQMNSNLAQEYSKVTCDMKFAPCHASLFSLKFSTKTCKNSDLGFHY